jgi:hypothetical protein
MELLHMKDGVNPDYKDPGSRDSGPKYKYSE